jgi:hypothetical protein
LRKYQETLTAVRSVASIVVQLAEHFFTERFDEDKKNNLDTIDCECRHEIRYNKANMHQSQGLYCTN